MRLLLFLLVMAPMLCADQHLDLFSPIEKPCGLVLEENEGTSIQLEKSLTKKAKDMIAAYSGIFLLIRQMRSREAVALRVAFHQRLLADHAAFRALIPGHYWTRMDYLRCLNLLDSHHWYLKEEIHQRQKNMATLIWDKIRSVFG